MRATSTTWSPCGSPLARSVIRTKKTSKVPSAETIAKLADSGKSVSRFFTNKGVMMKPIQRVNVDFAPGMLSELDVKLPN
jgi:hypothetical protein